MVQGEWTGREADDQQDSADEHDDFWPNRQASKDVDEAEESAVVHCEFRLTCRLAGRRSSTHWDMRG